MWFTQTWWIRTQRRRKIIIIKPFKWQKNTRIVKWYLIHEKINELIRIIIKRNRTIKRLIKTQLIK